MSSDEALRQWQPIETAPKDGTRILLLYKNGRIVCGDFDQDKYSRKPDPYWSHDQERLFGKRDAKQNPPISWTPFPSVR